ncbi:hypothetical protein JX266_005086 [Neoarthrinium moseri]|nr:hypothetical protein JX266_005086 [Neoarthrinium moseri]
MESNTAAWLTAAKARPFEIKSAPMGAPGEHQILVKNHAIAVNPIDGKLQSLAIYPMEYPAILGQDVAGEIVAVGPGVTRFKTGDRVLGTAAGFGTKRSEDRAFQTYTILESNMACQIPDDMTYASAAVLPLGISTAAAGLFNDDFLALQAPTYPTRSSMNKSLLVWGGASSVGCNAIQLAVAAGYEVFATSSPKNFNLVQELGASRVFDYHSPTIVADILDALKGKVSVGILDAVGGAAWVPSMEIAQKLVGAKFIATTITGFPEPPEGVLIKQMHALSIVGNNLSKAIFEDFLPIALAKKAYAVAPAPLIAGHGLESIQDAVDLQARGVSAKKVVVTL